MKRVLVTGAFGNIGSNVVAALRKQGHRVRALSHDWKRDRAVAKRFDRSVEIVRGDVRSATDMNAAVLDQDVVIHLAFVIPPMSNEQPALAKTVNLGGTRAVIDAIKRMKAPAKLLFASTLDVYGHTQHLEAPRKVSDPMQGTDEYSRHKIECERMVRESGLTWAIFRFADVPPIELRTPHPIMFSIPLSQRIEMVHPLDAGLAVANGVSGDEIWSKVLHIGGGARCQLRYGEYLNAFLEAMEIGALPESWFTKEPYCTDWLDTEESQALLQYQRHSFRDVVDETAALLGWRRPFARLFKSVVRRQIGRMSPHRLNQGTWV